jgi:hypothetical protein
MTVASIELLEFQSQLEQSFCSKLLLVSQQVAVVSDHQTKRYIDSASQHSLNLIRYAVTTKASSVGHSLQLSNVDHQGRPRAASIHSHSLVSADGR